MNSEEQTLIDGLFSRLQQAETDSAPRDAQAEARIKEHLTRQPAAGYFMTQAILVQEAAVKSLDAQNKQLTQQVQQLQAELQSAKAQAAAPAPSGGGFAVFPGPSGGARRPAPTGWRRDLFRRARRRLPPPARDGPAIVKSINPVRRSSARGPSPFRRGLGRGALPSTAARGTLPRWASCPYRRVVKKRPAEISSEPDSDVKPWSACGTADSAHVNKAGRGARQSNKRRRAGRRASPPRPSKIICDFS